MASGSFRIACDIGGTFSDVMVEAEGRLTVRKAASTPEDPIRGLLSGFDLAAADLGLPRQELLRRTETFIHGTTRAINAILTGITARTAFLTTAGHPDILVLREGGRLDPFDFTVPFPEPYVPRALTFEVPERIDAAGRVVRPLDEKSARRVIASLAERQVEAVGVLAAVGDCQPGARGAPGRAADATFAGRALHAVASVEPDPARVPARLGHLHQRVPQALDERLPQAPGQPVEGRGLRRPGAGADVKWYDDGCGRRRAGADPCHQLRPCDGAGCRGALRRGRGRGESAIVADAGGTSYDVTLVRRGDIPRTSETWLGPRFRGHMTGFPSVDVKSIGAGGGSIAWVDEGGLLHVGPRSAGAVPGPACYGRGGTAPTVTDAALVLGYLNAAFFLGGALLLDTAVARRAIEDGVASPLALPLDEAAAAVIAVATEHMAGAIAEITIGQGVDPAGAVLIGGGGAAGLNSVAIARRLGCAKVVIPEVGAALSAAGALLSEIGSEFARMGLTTTRDFAFDRVDRILNDLAAAAADFVAGAGHGSLAQQITFSVEARYPHQAWEVEVLLPGGHVSTGDDVEHLADAFHARHMELFGVAERDSAIELVTWRARARCEMREGPLPRLPHAWNGASRTIREKRVLPRAAMGRSGGAAVRDPRRGRRGGRSRDRRIRVHHRGRRAGRAGAASRQWQLGDHGLKEDEGMAAKRTAMANQGEPADGSRAGVRTAILANRLETIARKMANTLFRTARSGLINTARDLSCCIVTARHELLAEAESLPSHVLIGPDIMSRTLREHHPAPRRGDAYLHNSPYHGNSHAADHAIMVPVIDDQGIHRLTAFAKAHQADCGNSAPTSYFATGRDVYEEGALIFPAVQVQRDYRDIDDIIRMCRLRIRVPDQWYGDYLALIGAARIGERELMALGREVGWDTLEEHTQLWFDYSETRMAAAIGRLPAGRATRVAMHDPFPGTPEEGVAIRSSVTVDPAAGTIEVDLRDNPDCLPNGLNVTEANASAAAMIGVFSGIGQNVPRNAGSYRRVRILLRDGCCAGGPRHPACCSLSTTNLASKIGNATQAALAELADGFGLAEAGSIVPASMAVISGRDPRADDATFMNSLFLMHTGGAGAPAADAWLTTVHIGDLGLCYLDSVEIDELRYPILVEQRRLLTDTEGAGKYRGAPSALAEFGPVDTTIEAWFASDGTVNPSQGVRGGLCGGTAAQQRRRVDGELEEVAACGGVTLAPGERLVSICCGGGGYGSPLSATRSASRSTSPRAGSAWPAPTTFMAW